MKKVKMIFCCMAITSAIVLFLSGCSQSSVHGQSIEPDDSLLFGYQYRQVMTLTLGADNTFVEEFIVKLPEGVSSDNFYDVNVKFMGNLEEVMALAIWDSAADAERLLFSSVDNYPILLVLEFTDSGGYVVGHSLTNSPIINAITHECYVAEIERIIWDLVWGPINYCSRLNAFE